MASSLACGGTKLSTWAAAGLAVSLAMALTALWRAARGSGNFYASAVYAMTRRTHAGYALAGFVLCAAFAVSYVRAGVPVVPLLGAAVLLAILYFTSFLRGFSDEE